MFLDYEQTSDKDKAELTETFLQHLGKSALWKILERIPY